MIRCEVCNGENFETHAGFMYCSVCQTQSQEFHEQEYEYQVADTTRRVKSQKNENKQRKEKNYDKGGVWTSWEAFNYILYGMTQEVKKIETKIDFELLVLKLWAAYLKESKVAFTSKTMESVPKLGFNFKPRDAKVLFNVDANSYASSERRKINEKSRSVNSSFISNSSISSRSLSKKRSKLVAMDYEDQFSASDLNRSNLADETLESLGKHSDSEFEKLSESSGEILENFKEILKKSDYKLYKKSYKIPKLMKIQKYRTARDVRFIAKNKLLSILHLALLLSGSEIQLSDLLRFIREGHISFAKVTHFLPSEVRFSQKDIAYIDVTSDSSMPTHLRQRKIASQLAHLLRIEAVPTPNMFSLVRRYCRDLNLPDQIMNLSEKIVSSYVPHLIIPRAKTLLPSYEAWAMAAIIFILKIIFGLDGETEVVLSDLARKVNSTRKSEEETLFVFEDWQKFQEFRKTVLIEHHYPTLEQLEDNIGESSKRFLDMITKESKDEHRNHRFIPYSKYYIEEKLMNSIKEMLQGLTIPQHLQFTDFPPSLTPQTSYAETIICNLQNDAPFPVDILTKNFQKCDVLFALNSHSYFTLPQTNGGGNSGITSKKKSPYKSSFNYPPRYWMVPYASIESSHLENFKCDVLEKTSETFQWVIKECARMIEMNVRDVYEELLRLETKFSSHLHI